MKVNLLMMFLIVRINHLKTLVFAFQKRFHERILWLVFSFRNRIKVYWRSFVKRIHVLNRCKRINTFPYIEIRYWKKVITRRSWVQIYKSKHN